MAAAVLAAVPAPDATAAPALDDAPPDKEEEAVGEADPRRCLAPPPAIDLAMSALPAPPVPTTNDPWDSSMPVALGDAAWFEYTANATRGDSPVRPNPRSTISDSSPRSALRGSQVPLNGSALASPGNSSVAVSLQHASVRLVAVPPASEG